MTNHQRKIIQFGHPTLRQKSAAVPLEYISSPEIQELIASLKSSIPEHGIGLAAPQINLAWRIFLADIYRNDWQEKTLGPITGPVICLNPLMRWRSDDTSVDWEGCLSAPGFWGQVRRPNTIEVSYINESGQQVEASLSGVGARVFQHELDHLDGILFVDRMTDIKTLITDEEFEKIRDDVR
jgi:peptide deformylase